MKDFKTIWKTLAAEKKLNNYHFIQRAVLIAMNSKSNVPKMDIIHGLLQKHFTPITNANKLNNGCVPFSSLKNSAWYLGYSKSVLNVPMEEFFDSPEEEKLFKELIKGIDYRKLGRKYVYYFTTQEGLTAEQQGVQAGHALFALGVALGEKNAGVNPHETYFQWIGVKTDKELNAVRVKCHKAGYTVHTFFEPDLNYKLTSIALEPILWNKRGDLIEYKLLSHS